MWKTFYNQLGKYKTAAILAPIYTGLDVVMSILIPYVTASIIDKGIMAGSMREVLYYGSIMVLLAILCLLFGFLAGRSAAFASTGFGYNLRDAMYRRIQTYSFSNIDKFSTASLVTRMTTDVSRIQQATQMILVMLVRAPLTLVTSIVMCLVINPGMSLIFVAAIVVLALGITLIASRVIKLFSQVFKQYDQMNQAVQENVSAIREVKSYVHEEYETNKFNREARLLYDLSKKSEVLMANISPMMMLVMNGTIIAISWFGAQFIVGGTLTTGELTSMLSYVMQVLISLMLLSVIFIIMTMSAAAAKRIVEVIKEEPDISNIGTDQQITVSDGSIGFNHVSFSYSPSGEYVLNDIHFIINAGETIGIIGGTGCGKSTLVSLIARLYDVTKGQVMVGGNDVRSYDLTVLRHAVAMVPQKSTLFSGSVIENLRWGNPDATLKACRDACRLACADSFVEAMPQGYETHIEQGGTNISGGQRQRLCIARALLTQPNILILDDATSAVDTTTDAKIRKALRETLPHTTKLIISQRVSSVQDTDRILVMDNGNVVAFDTHERLMANNETYQEIYASQAGGNADFDL